MAVGRLAGGRVFLSAASLLWFIEPPCATSFEGAQSAHVLLGPANVASPVPLFGQPARVQRLCLPVVGTLAATVTATGVGRALGLCAVGKIDARQVGKSPVWRCF